MRCGEIVYNEKRREASRLYLPEISILQLLSHQPTNPVLRYILRIKSSSLNTIMSQNTQPVTLLPVICGNKLHNIVFNPTGHIGNIRAFKG